MGDCVGIRIDLNDREGIIFGLHEAGVKGKAERTAEGIRLEVELDYSAVYGLGERFDRVNQKGASVRTEVIEKFCSQGNVSYLPVPFFFTDADFGLFVDTQTVVEFGFQERITVAVKRDSNGVLPVLYLFGGKPKEILEAFSGMTGRPAMAPEWSFGVWMSANRWNTQEEVLRQAETAKRLGFPASVLVIEAWSDEATFYRYHENGEWKEPEAMIRRLKDQGIHTVLWQIPVFKKMDNGERHEVLEQDWEYAVSHKLCIQNTDGSPYVIPEGHWFAGSMLPDFSNPETKEWWFGKRQYLLDMGVDGFKTDGGEFILTDEVKSFDGRTGLELRNGYAADYVRAYHEFIGEDRVLFSRAGYTGQQRYPMQWAGDQASTWEEFRHVITAGLTAGLSGIPFWGFDIAGFAGALPGPELYERATQAAVFCPVMQWHSEPAGGQFADLMPAAEGINDRSPWNMAKINGDGEFLKRLRNLHMLRRSLQPYLLDQARKSCETGLPMMRHMFLEYPGDKRAAAAEDCFLLGDLLVCPVLEEADGGCAKREVYLPEGEWMLISELLFGDQDERVDSQILAFPDYHGAQSYTLSVSRGQIPVFIREGGAAALGLKDSVKDGENKSEEGNETVTDNRAEDTVCFYLAGEQGQFRFVQGRDCEILVEWNREDVQIRQAGETRMDGNRIRYRRI